MCGEFVHADVPARGELVRGCGSGLKVIILGREFEPGPHRECRWELVTQKNRPGRVARNSPRLVRGMLCSLSFTCVAPGGEMCMDVHTVPGIYCQLALSTQLYEVVVDIIFPSMAR